MRSAFFAVGVAFGLALSVALWYAFGLALVALTAIVFTAFWLAFEVAVARRGWARVKKTLCESHERFDHANAQMELEKHRA